MASGLEIVARGDLSNLAKYKATGNGTGKRSEQDKLVPAMILLMENLQSLVTDTEMLSKSAVEGRLEVRADASRHLASIVRSSRESMILWMRSCFRLTRRLTLCRRSQTVS